MNWAPRRATVAISAVLVILGVAILVETAVVGGGIGSCSARYSRAPAPSRLYLSGRV